MANSLSLGRHRFVPLAATALLVLLLFAPLSTNTASAEQNQPNTGIYTNPVISTTAPDPSIIKALDGYYYIFTTAGTRPGGVTPRIPIWRSKDLVNWDFIGAALPDKPDWTVSGFWAPDIQYFNHKYYMYYTVHATKVGGRAIGVATADSPAGPWTDSGGPLIGPEYTSVIDPAVFTDSDGQRYIYWGSYPSGTMVQKLSRDGLHTEGPVFQIGHANRYEGTYVIRHEINGKTYYYNFSSAAGCCHGPNTAYSVETNRATSPMGPFVDQNGYPMLLNSPVLADSPGNLAHTNIGAEGGGYPTLKDNGNRWHGVGHNAIITDLSGQQWIVYHGIDKYQGWTPDLGPNARATFRQLLIDRLDWTPDGWPVVNGGKGPSGGPVPAPTTTPVVGDNFNASEGCAAPGNGSDLSAVWNPVTGDWDRDPGDCTTGGFVRQLDANGQALLVSRASGPSDFRAGCDLKLESGDGRYGCVVAYHEGAAGENNGRYIAAFIDVASNSLVTVAYNNGHPIDHEWSTSLPASFDPTDWHHLSVTQNPDSEGRPTFRFVVTSRDRDPMAVQERSFPADYSRGGGTGFITKNARAAFDNVSVAHAADTSVAAPQTPPAGDLLSAYTDEFNGKLGSQWSWIREDPSKHGFVDGQLQIIVNGDLYRQGNSATNLLVEDQPSGDYVVETKLTFDPNQNFQQAGLLIYSDDDHYIKVGHLHNGSLNKVLSGRETLEAQPDSRVPGQPECDVQPSPTSNIAVKSYSHEQCPTEGEAWDYLTNPKPTLNGSTAYDPQVTVWLRIYRHGDVYTPYSSLDGTHWVKGTAWSLTPASPDFPIRIGLFAFSGGPHNDVPARFDYVRVYRYTP